MKPTNKFKETEIGKIPEDWDVIAISKVVDIIGGGTPKTSNPEYWGGDIPWISVADFVGNSRWIRKTEKNITKKGLEESSTKILHNGQLVISARGTVGELGQVTRDMAFNQSCYGLDGKTGMDNDFLYYLLRFRLKDIQSKTHGSVFNTITRDTFDQIMVPVPAPKEQHAIAKILSDLDAKIELNHQMNATLEKMAEALFKHWFVDFEFPNEQGKPYKSNGGKMIESELGEIPEGWRIGRLNEISNLLMGLSPKSSSYNENEVGCPLLNGAADFSDGRINAKKFTSDPTRICKKDDLLLCIRATIGNITFADKSYCLGRGVAALTPKSIEYQEFIYFQLMYGLDQLVSKASGSVILGLSKPDIENLNLILPSGSLLKKFHQNVCEIFKLMEQLRQEKAILTNIRDSLLPKLMSGNIRVSM